MSIMLLEERVKVYYDMAIIEFLEDCLRNQMTVIEIAETLETSESNLRRLARKNSVRLHEVKKVPMIRERSQFLDQNLNHVNFLYREWKGVKI